MKTNSKFKIRNPKQYQISNDSSSKYFENCEFEVYFEFSPPRKLTDSNYEFYQTNGAYYPFGEMITGTGDVHGFTGKELDNEMGLNYFCQRYYDSQIGRFITLDPVDDKKGTSPYAYCANNPLKFNDPTGEKFSYLEMEERYWFLKDYGIWKAGQPDLWSTFASWPGSMASYMRAHPEFYQLVLENEVIGEILRFNATYVKLKIAAEGEPWFTGDRKLNKKDIKEAIDWIRNNMPEAVSENLELFNFEFILTDISGAAAWGRQYMNPFRALEDLFEGKMPDVTYQIHINSRLARQCLVRIITHETWETGLCRRWGIPYGIPDSPAHYATIRQTNLWFGNGWGW